MRIAISVTLASIAACALIAGSVTNADPMTKVQTQHSGWSSSKIPSTAGIVSSLQQKTATTTAQPKFINRLYRRRARLLTARKEQPEEPEEIDEDEEEGRGSNIATGSKGLGNGKVLEPTVHTTTDGAVRTVTQTGDKVIAGAAPQGSTLVKAVSNLNGGAKSSKAPGDGEEAGDGGTAGDAVDEEEVGRPDSA